MKKSSSPNYSSSWKDKPKKEGSSSNSKEEASIKKPIPTTSSSTSKSRDIKCFRCLGKGHIASECPNKKTMVVRDNGSISSEEISSHSSSSSDEENDGAAYAQDGDLLVREQLISSVKEIVAKFDLTAAEALLFVQISISAKGDRAFCSEECRQKKIFMDEEGMKRNHCSFSATAAASNRSKPRKNGGKDTASVAGRLAC
ncbi:hypothetical protein ZIOFF_035723 [Zingiber officinale]|uniref:CCHC-type domain-containing protein n=1 Tax=Zingiber officinale TaxID=94328 RepID=A0A8J5L7B4_ZINOF|nr:hypothetical protein ZIOFF_035723 [Zingiber officinale]